MTRRLISLIVTTNYSPRVFKRTLPLGVARGLIVLGIALAFAVVAALMVASASLYRLGRLSYLEHRNRTLEFEFSRMAELRERLERLEAEKARMAAMLGVELTPPAIDWSSVPLDSTALPEWAVGEWGGRPVPVLTPIERYVLSRQFDSEHAGLDMAAQSGTSVRSAADGVVVEADTDSVFGRFLLVRHPGEYATYYGHLSDWRAVAGDTVRAGQTIGLVGTTGRSSAPHLHFEVRRDGSQVDPTSIIRFQD